MQRDYKLFYTGYSASLAQEICKKLWITPGKLLTKRFPDGECNVVFEESIRGKTVFILGQADMPYEKLIELFFAIDAAKRASADEIVAVIPYLPHSRPEGRSDFRSAHSGRLIADFLEHAGMDRLITVDLHDNTLEGYFRKPVDEIKLVSLFTSHMLENLGQNFRLASPDLGGVNRIKRYKEKLGKQMVIIQNEVLHPNQHADLELIGEVKGKTIVLIDDIIDSANTITKASDFLIQKGAERVVAYATHALLSGDAIDVINKSSLDKLCVTNTVNIKQRSEKIELISCAGMIAKAIDNLAHNRSISKLSK